MWTPVWVIDLTLGESQIVCKLRVHFNNLIDKYLASLVPFSNDWINQISGLIHSCVIFSVWVNCVEEDI